VRIAIDVMGGDNAPDAILAGGLDAVELLTSEDRLVLVGDAAVIQAGIAARGLTKDPRLEIIATTQVITMGASPITALRAMPDSSILRMAKLGGARGGAERCDVIISAGNTGACVAAAQMSMRRLPGVHRPGIGAVIPTFHGPVVLCDVGANPEPRPNHLHQYGHMAAVYAQRVLAINHPKVALLSIGDEEAKGNSLVKEAHQLMKADASLAYVGLMEGRDIFEGRAQVVVTEGFTGNVVLKLSEGLASGIFKIIAREVLAISPELAKQFEPVVARIYRKHDYHEYGGAPLLGTNGICMICHGSSEARTIKAAVKRAQSVATRAVNAGIVEALARAKSVPEGTA
jgi:glycerol-3-phosphate acyltransferase PlsX